jgi:hypothetical protein
MGRAVWILIHGITPAPPPLLFNLHRWAQPLRASASVGAGPAFAGDVTAAKTEADCAKAGGTWNATTKMCEEKKM